MGSRPRARPLRAAPASTQTTRFVIHPEHFVSGSSLIRERVEREDFPGPFPSAFPALCPLRNKSRWSLRRQVDQSFEAGARVAKEATRSAWWLFRPPVGSACRKRWSHRPMCPRRLPPTPRAGRASSNLSGIEKQVEDKKPRALLGSTTHTTF